MKLTTSDRGRALPWLPCEHDFQSRAVGVGRYDFGGRPFVRSATALVLLAMGVGKNVNPLPPMGRSGMGSTHHGRSPGVAARFQVAENPVSPSLPEEMAVLNNNPIGSDFSDDACVFSPEIGASAVDAFAATRRADILAGEPATDDIHGNSICRKLVAGEGPHVVIAGNPRPMFREHAAGVWLNLAEGDGTHSRPFEAKAEASDSAEQVKDVHPSTAQATNPTSPQHGTAQHTLASRPRAAARSG